VESTAEPTEIVVHVNMLKEGWDVTNLYTIIPLRAANARILIEQSIGRGLRLPYGKRTGVAAVDRLNIIAHDKFQEIVDEAKRPDSQIRMTQLILVPESLQEKTVTLISHPQIDNLLGLQAPPSQQVPSLTNASTVQFPTPAPVFTTPASQKIAQLTYQAIHKLETQPQTVPNTAHIASPAGQALVKEAVLQSLKSTEIAVQQELEGITEPPDIDAIIAQTTDIVIAQTIDIPRIIVIPKGEVRSGFHAFSLDLTNLNYPVPSTDLWVQTLRNQEIEVIGLRNQESPETRLEDYIVSGLIDFDDISYDEQADLLYDLASQVTRHFRAYLEDEDIHKVLRVYQRPIAELIHAQMQPHFWEETSGYEVQVSRGFTELKPCAYTVSSTDSILDFRQSPSDKSNMAKYLFDGFTRCLYPNQKFQSEAERVLAVILDRDALKWFKPVKSQFQLYYNWQGDQREYQPDFVAETSDAIYMLEPKARNQMDAEEVQEKKSVATQWCTHASDYTQQNAGKPWFYLLIPHDEIKENMTIQGLTNKFLSK
jgi:type III restriction enzyme